MTDIWAIRNARAAARKFNPADVPEPAELTEQCENHAANRKLVEQAAKEPCASCGKALEHADHFWGSSTLAPACHFTSQTED